MAAGPDLSFTELDKRATALISQFNDLHRRMMDLLYELNDEDREDGEVEQMFATTVLGQLVVYNYLRAEGLTRDQAEYGAVMSLIMSVHSVASREAADSPRWAEPHAAVVQRCVDKIKQLRSAS